MKGFRLEIVKAWNKFRDPYRPELHYMRGPGPRCLARERQKAAEVRSARESVSSSRLSQDSILAN